MNFTKEQIKERVENLGGQVNEDITIAQFSFEEEVSNDGGESITSKEAISIEGQMMDLGFAGGLIGSTLDAADWTILRFDI